MKVIGLMSGTSMDGLDCCYVDIEIDEEYKMNYEIIDFKTIDFDFKPYNLIKSTIGSFDKEKIQYCDNKLGTVFLEFVKKFIKGKEFDLISMHGQTIRHKSKEESIQIGSPYKLYNFFKKPIIYNFRKKDIILGGNGAPLVPFLDWLLFKDLKKRIITLNIGGISNVTLIPEDSKRENVLGFDTGPGMCLIDRFVNLVWHKNFDNDGSISEKGKINFNILNYLMEDEYVNLNYPKSISTEYYNIDFIKKIIHLFPDVNKFDLLRTFVRFTALSVYENINFFIKDNNDYSLILSGGGTKNLVLISDLKYFFGKNISSLKEFINIDEDIKEGLLMSVMGYCRYKKLNNNMPSVTGANKYDTYGDIYE